MINAVVISESDIVNCPTEPEIAPEGVTVAAAELPPAVDEGSSVELLPLA